MVTSPETRGFGCLFNLKGNLGKDSVLRRKGDGTLDLHLKRGRVPRLVMGFDDDIVERIAFVCPLKLDGMDLAAGQATRMNVQQHRQEVASSYLSFEVRTRRSAGCWARHNLAGDIHYRSEGVFLPQQVA